MNRPPSIPQNYLFYKGEWCHPSRVKVAEHFQNGPQTHSNAPTTHPDTLEGIKTPKRIRQSTKPLLNALESEWFRDCGKFFLVMYSQAIRFKLGNGIWYKPDFISLKAMTCWEIKGPHSFRGGFENLKVAAHQYPEFKWVLTWKEHGQWKEQIVLP